MQVVLNQFDPARFSFHDHPVLVIENFWSKTERHTFRRAMQGAPWTTLDHLRHTRETFPGCGNWWKGEIARPEASLLLERLDLPCIKTYMESFPRITGRHMNFNYYSYGAGDCLPTHDDTAPTGQAARSAQDVPLRRLAVATYFHEEWHPDWGGELMVYRKRSTSHGRSELAIAHCIAPNPGSLVLFTVPRFHRVCRVDPASGDRRRLSIAGWFMTQSAEGPTTAGVVT